MYKLNKYLKYTAISIATLISCFISLFILFVIYLQINEFKPQEKQNALLVYDPNPEDLVSDKELSILTYNIGYACLGEKQDFYLDGGRQVRPESINDVKENLIGILHELNDIRSDIYFFQEVDLKAKRSYKLNQLKILTEQFPSAYSFAYNLKVKYIPVPLFNDPIGEVYSGLLNISNFQIKEAQRISLPSSFSWPEKLANFKRCLLLNRLSIKNSDKDLVLINLHIDAYTDDKNKDAQINYLKKIMNEEEAKGNFVIAGGDFNAVFQSRESSSYPYVKNPYWQPAILDENLFDTQKWTYVFDQNAPSVKVNNLPYLGNEDKVFTYVVDGFIVSKNIEVSEVKSINTNFKYSDHRPVKMTFKLKN